MAAHQAPCSWDSPGKNTGVGCHFLLQCRKVKSESEVAQSCPTLSDPVDCSPPGSSVHGIFQARVLDGVGYHCLLHNYCAVLCKSKNISPSCNFPIYWLLYSIHTGKNFPLKRHKPIPSNHIQKHSPSALYLELLNFDVQESYGFWVFSYISYIV